MKKAFALPQELKVLMLAKPRLTLSVAESMTCGCLQAAIGSVSGASEFFVGGLTAYTLDQKVRCLGVKRAQARAVNCVSAAVADQMALGAVRLFKSDFALATTGYAEPSAEREVLAPFAFWSLARLRRKKASIILHGRFECAGAKRREAQQWIAESVLAELVEYLKRSRTGS